MRLSTRSITFLSLLLLGCAGTQEDRADATDPAVVARDYPTRLVRIVEPFGAGGGPDLLARALAPQFSELWGQPVIVENISGAGATAGPAHVAKSPADGYTLLTNTSAQAYSAALSKNLPYDPLRDFVPVIPLTSQPYVLVAGKSAGVTTSASSLRRRRRNRVSSSLAPPVWAPVRTLASRNSIRRQA